MKFWSGQWFLLYYHQVTTHTMNLSIYSGSFR